MKHTKKENKDLTMTQAVRFLISTSRAAQKWNGLPFKTVLSFGVWPPASMWRDVLICKVLAFMSYSYLAFVSNLRICFLLLCPINGKHWKHCCFHSKLVIGSSLLHPTNTYWIAGRSLSTKYIGPGNALITDTALSSMSYTREIFLCMVWGAGPEVATEPLGTGGSLKELTAEVNDRGRVGRAFQKESVWGKAQMRGKLIACAGKSMHCGVARVLANRWENGILSWTLWKASALTTLSWHHYKWSTWETREETIFCKIRISWIKWHLFHVRNLW